MCFLKCLGLIYSMPRPLLFLCGCLTQFSIGFVFPILFNMAYVPLVSSKSKFCVGTMMAINNLIFPYNRQVALELVFNLDHLKTTHSPIVPGTTKDKISNWIDSKIIDSLTSLAFYHVRKFFIWLIGLVEWFCVGIVRCRIFICVLMPMI